MVGADVPWDVFDMGLAAGEGPDAESDCGRGDEFVRVYLGRDSEPGRAERAGFAGAERKEVLARVLRDWEAAARLAGRAFIAEEDRVAAARPDFARRG